jgi:hypothetical protein
MCVVKRCHCVSKCGVHSVSTAHLPYAGCGIVGLRASYHHVMFCLDRFRSVCDPGIGPGSASAIAPCWVSWTLTASVGVSSCGGSSTNGASTQVQQGDLCRLDVCSAIACLLYNSWAVFTRTHATAFPSCIYTCVLSHPLLLVLHGQCLHYMCNVHTHTCTYTTAFPPGCAVAPWHRFRCDSPACCLSLPPPPLPHSLHAASSSAPVQRVGSLQPQ